LLLQAMPRNVACQQAGSTALMTLVVAGFPLQRVVG
jgi:hypothetical protein